MNLYSEKYSKNVAKTTGYAGFRNRRRLLFFNKLIPINKNDAILEIGPNNCLLIDSFKKRAKSVIGIDINDELVREMNRTDLIYMDATNMTFQDESFNVVIGVEVFEHIPSLERVFSEIERVLIVGGKCYMTVPFEFFRGQQALGDAWNVYHDFAMAQKLHVHKLNPKRIRALISRTRFVMIKSKLIWIPGPSYFIVLEKK